MSNADPGLHIILGPMRARKSLMLALHYEQFQCRYTHDALAWFSPSFGERPEVIGTAVSRAFGCSIQIPHRRLVEGDAAFESIAVEEQWEAVFVDEAQFFGDGFLSFVYRCLDAHLPVFVSALNGNFRAEPMGCVPRLVALATSIEFHKAICSVCSKPAAFTILKDVKSVCDGDVLVGDEQYASVCWKCKRRYAKEIE